MKDWETKIEIRHCRGTENPRLFNFNFERTGGRLGYAQWSATFKEDELIEIADQIRGLATKESD